MKIIQYSDFGGPEVLELVESEKPLPATVSLDRGMNVTVHAVGLNPVDYKTFNGSLRFLEKLQRIINPKKWFQRRSSTFPRGVARDFAGVDDAGNAVLGTLYQPVTSIMRQGALATEILIAPEDMTLKPEGISFETAAALGVPGQAACGAFLPQVGLVLLLPNSRSTGAQPSSVSLATLMPTTCVPWGQFRLPTGKGW